MGRRTIRARDNEVDPNFSIPDEADEFYYGEPPNEDQDTEEAIDDGVGLRTPQIIDYNEKVYPLLNGDQIVKLVLIHDEIPGAEAYEYRIRMLPPQGDGE